MCQERKFGIEGGFCTLFDTFLSFPNCLSWTYITFVARMKIKKCHLFSKNVSGTYAGGGCREDRLGRRGLAALGMEWGDAGEGPHERKWVWAPNNTGWTVGGKKSPGKGTSYKCLSNILPHKITLILITVSFPWVSVLSCPGMAEAQASPEDREVAHWFDSILPNLAFSFLNLCCLSGNWVSELITHLITCSLSFTKCCHFGAPSSVQAMVAKILAHTLSCYRCPPCHSNDNQSSHVQAKSLFPKDLRSQSQPWIDLAPGN